MLTLEPLDAYSIDAGIKGTYFVCGTTESTYSLNAYSLQSGIVGAISCNTLSPMYSWYMA